MSTIPGKGPPLVSVIVPTYADRALRLQSALASIWALDGLCEQFDVEPIVVDDASKGPTEEVVRRFPGTRYVRHDTNRGVSAARNTGLAEATGKYVAFLDDDDLWLPYRLSAQVAVLEQAQGVEVVYSQRVAYVRDGTSGGVFPDPEGPSGWVFETGVKWFVCHINTILVSREAIDKVGGFDESLLINEDNDWVARLAFLFPFRYVPGIVAIWLPSMTPRSPQLWVSTLLKRRDNQLALIEGEPNEAEIRRLVLSTTSWQLAYRLLRAEEFDEARRAFIQWFAEYAPRSRRVTRGGTATHPAGALVSPPLEGDIWARSRMTELIHLLVFASDSPLDQAKALCTEIKRVGGERGLKQRLEMRALLADVWTAVALRLASRGRRNTAGAGSAAGRAILQNPLKPLARPGLLRLVARAIPPS
jgi:GT2 family glycosyltransferase